jgi:hypothetical protein
MATVLRYRIETTIHLHIDFIEVRLQREERG